MTRFVAGQWNYECQRCGAKRKSGEIRLEWTGFRVCGDCYDERHPQDFVKARPDKEAVPWSNPPEFSVSGVEVDRDDL